MLRIKTPERFMNVAITLDNYLIADTNDSSNWKTFKKKLPDGHWKIWNVEGEYVLLIIDTTSDEKDDKTRPDTILDDVRAIVTSKYIKAISLNETATGNEKRLAVIIECELIDDLPERLIGKTVKISEHFSKENE